ncbi:LysE family translocator [Streptomyces sp. NPDC054863]
MVLGIQTGTLVRGVLGAAGITAVLTASPLAYELLRWAGAAYLVWTGGRILLSALRRRAWADLARADTPDAPDADDSFGGGWRQGALTNLLNPKVGAFSLAVLPQFVPAGAAHLTTAACRPAYTSGSAHSGPAHSSPSPGRSAAASGGPPRAGTSTGSAGRSSPASASASPSSTDRHRPATMATPRPGIHSGSADLTPCARRAAGTRCGAAGCGRCAAWPGAVVHPAPAGTG